METIYQLDNYSLRRTLMDYITKFHGEKIIVDRSQRISIITMKDIIPSIGTLKNLITLLINEIRVSHSVWYLTLAIIDVLMVKYEELSLKEYHHLLLMTHCLSGKIIEDVTYCTITYLNIMCLDTVNCFEIDIEYFMMVLDNCDPYQIMRDRPIDEKLLRIISKVLNESYDSLYRKEVFLRDRRFRKDLLTSYSDIESGYEASVSSNNTDNGKDDSTSNTSRKSTKSQDKTFNKTPNHPNKIPKIKEFGDAKSGRDYQDSKVNQDNKGKEDKLQTLQSYRDTDIDIDMKPLNSEILSSDTNTGSNERFSFNKKIKKIRRKSTNFLKELRREKTQDSSQNLDSKPNTSTISRKRKRKRLSGSRSLT